MMLKNHSIKFKLIFITTFSSSIALLVFSFILLYYETAFIKRDLMNNLQTQVDIISENSLASLAFMDDSNTRKTLGALKHNPDILYAGLYNAQEHLLDAYHDETYQGKMIFVAGELQNMPRFLEIDNFIQIIHPIYLHGDLLGYLVLRSSFISSEHKLIDLTVIILAAFGVALLVALYLSLQLQRIVSRPIIDLANFIYHVIDSKTYDVRVVKSSNDEFGKLVDAFNLMLAQLKKSFEKRDEAESALSHHLTHLQEIVEEQTLGLQNALNVADLANHSKSDFLANMSHEIRTPMNAIVGMTHLAQRTNLTSKQRSYLDKIETASQILLSIINDILDFSKIEAGKLRLENTVFSLDTVLESLSDMLKLKAVQKNILFNFVVSSQTPQHLVGDSLRLGQILLNLLSNAVKFTEKGNVTMTIEPTNFFENRVELTFSVHDTGIGIGAEQMEKLFQSFSQADTSTTRKYGGTGLGLIICKQLAELMGGEICATSVLNSGSTFTLRAVFDLALEEDLPPPTQISDYKIITQPNTSRYNMQRILLVEDNEINQQVAMELLTSMGLQVTVVDNGQDGVALALAETFDLILMDIQMPVMDGLTAARLIRAARPNVPIIAMTAHAMQGDKEKSFAAGMNEHLTKPVNLDKLIGVLNRWLKIDQKIIKPSTKERLEKSLLPNKLPPFDLKLALTFCGDDPRLLHQLLLSFASRYKNSAEQLQQWIKNKAFTHAEYLTHSIKGVAGTLAAHDLRRAADKLEMSLHSQQIENLDVQVCELNNALTVAIDAIALLPLLTDEKNENDVLLNTEEFAILLMQFRTALRGNKFSATELFERLKQNLNQQGFSQAVNELEICLDELNFHAALSVLDKINIELTK